MSGGRGMAFTPQEQAEIRRRHQAGESGTAIALSLNRPPRSVRRWIRLDKAKGEHRERVISRKRNPPIPVRYVSDFIKPPTIAQLMARR